MSRSWRGFRVASARDPRRSRRWWSRMDRLPELGSLRAELRVAGVFEHCELRSWLKLALLVLGIAACLAAMAVLGAWAAIPAIPIAAVLCTSTAMLGHEGSHRSFSASPARG